VKNPPEGCLLLTAELKHFRLFLKVGLWSCEFTVCYFYIALGMKKTQSLYFDISNRKER